MCVLKLLSLILFGIGVILGSVSMGIGQWSRLETDRVDNSIVDGSTFKTQSLLSRCISYDFTRAIVDQGLTLELRPPEVGRPITTLLHTAMHTQHTHTHNTHTHTTHTHTHTHTHNTHTHTQHTHTTCTYMFYTYTDIHRHVYIHT